MFTKRQIETIMAKRVTGEHYAQFVRELKALGIVSYVHVVENGSNSYYDDNGNYISIKHPQQEIMVSNEPSPEKLQHSIALHQQGKTDYATFCVQVGEAGVAKWVSNLKKMTITYLDKKGEELLVEAIPAMRA